MMLTSAFVFFLSHVLMLVLTQLVCGRPKEDQNIGTESEEKQQSVLQCHNKLQEALSRVISSVT
jgi:hypothetical protein